MYFIELRMIMLIVLLMVTNTIADDEKSSVYKQIELKIKKIIVDADDSIHLMNFEDCVPDSIYEFSKQEKDIWEEDKKANKYLNDYFDSFEESLKELDKKINIL